jgi:hypothetical protein
MDHIELKKRCAGRDRDERKMYCVHEVPWQETSCTSGPPYLHSPGYAYPIEVNAKRSVRRTLALHLRFPSAPRRLIHVVAYLNLKELRRRRRMV